MKETINLHQFREGFRQVRPNNFSYEGLQILFEYLEQFEDDTGDELEFDVIAFCCDFAEDDWQSIAANYQGCSLDDDASDDDKMEAVADFLSDEGVYIGQTEGRIIYRQF